MNNKLIFLRHAKTKKDKEIPVSNWDLTEDAYQATQEMANTGIFDKTDIFISSTEKKAFLTIKPFADRKKQEVIQIEELSDLNRDSGKVMPKEDYDRLKVKIFENLDYTEFGWETCNHALERFKKAIEEINKKYENKTILIGSHGTVMTLFFSEKANALDNIFPRWKSLGFLDYGIIENRKVTKDIV